MEGREGQQRFFDEDLADHQPFPLLSEALKVIDPSIGFNIEIKWSLKQEDGTPDLKDPIDMNIYVDKVRLILDPIYLFKYKQLNNSFFFKATALGQPLNMM